MTLSDDEGVLREEIVYSQHPQSEASRPVTFQPLTPYFYSFLSLYLTTVEGINACLSHDVPENNLLYVSDLESVAKIFGASKSSISGSGQNFKAGSKSLEEAEEWQFLRRERQRTSRPPTQAYPVNSTDRPEQLGGKMSWSDLDDFVRSDLGKSQALDYRSATLEALEALETRIWRIGLRAIIGMIWSAIEVLGFPLAYASLLHWNMGAGNYKAYSLIGGLLFCGTFVVCYLEEKNPRQAVEP
ncbi:MAG: hypothetical protein M1814_002223 [Vezdaea aestivalis]|nr:MAG: hypothetical protein M1814_002223 [Vezdaea aestivalis]